MSVMATTGTPHERARHRAAGRWPPEARRTAPRPVLIGFGIDTPARAAAAARHADGVIVASALMRRVLDGAHQRRACGRDVGRTLRTARRRGPPARPAERDGPQAGRRRSARPAAEVPADPRRAAGPDHQRPVAGGQPLPAQRELAGEFGVSIMTLRQALQLLADDGLIDTRHGSGTYVAPGTPTTWATCAASPPTSPPRAPGSAPGCWPPGSSRAPEEVGARLGGPGRGAPAAPAAAGRRAAADRADLLPPAELTRAAGPVRTPGTLDVGNWPSAGCTRCWPSTGWPSPGPAETITPVLLDPADAADLGRDPRPARRCSATGSASPRPASPSSTTTRCCPGTAWRSPRTAPPTGSTSTTRSLRATEPPRRRRRVPTGPTSEERVRRGRSRAEGDAAPTGLRSAERGTSDSATREGGALERPRRRKASRAGRW